MPSTPTPEALQNPIEQPSKQTGNYFLNQSTIKAEPQTFQFRAVKEIINEIYYRLLGQRTLVGEDKTVTIVQATDPLITEWGANRIISLIYPVANEQTPFANLSNDVIVGIFGNNIAKALNADMFRNFEKYFATESILEEAKVSGSVANLKSITNYQTTLKIISMLPIQIMSRSVGGTESQSFYAGQHVGIGINPQPQMKV